MSDHILFKALGNFSNSYFLRSNSLLCGSGNFTNNPVTGKHEAKHPNFPQGLT